MTKTALLYSKVVNHNSSILCYFTLLILFDGRYKPTAYVSSNLPSKTRFLYVFGSV